jgi:pyruvate, water dikinase
MKNVKVFSLIIILFSGTLSGQIHYSGRVIDCNTKNPVSNAEVYFQGSDTKATTDSWGQFSIGTGIGEENDDPGFKISIAHNYLLWRTTKRADITINNILGQETGFSLKSIIGNGEKSLEALPEGIYLVTYLSEGKRKVFKMWKSSFPDQSACIEMPVGKNPLKNATLSNDTIVISKSGYFTQKYACLQSSDVYELLKTGYNNLDYLDKLIRPEAFNMLQGLPLNPVYGEVKSLNIIYSIADQKVYFANSNKYFIHFDFAESYLGYRKGHAMFNLEQYKNNPNRIYILAILNHFTSSDIYTLEFFAGDQLECSQIETVFNKVAETTYIGNKLRLFVNSQGWNKCTNVPVISSDELYKGQNYQPLNTQENYGYLKKINVEELQNTYLGHHDIVLLNGIPIDISVVAGIITTDFQTPLSHVNVLSHNRGTPNMALRDGWENPKINNLLNKLVYLKVTLDSFIIREATLNKAEAFWQQKDPQFPQALKLDTLTRGLVDLAGASIESVPSIGGKAANFSELTKVEVSGYGPLPLPEGAFAIPVYYYWQHLRKYGLHDFINRMLKDNRFITDAQFRQNQLKILQDSIKHCPVDPGLLQLVNEKVAPLKNFKNIRFRSSTNSEDITGFNGAGLYDSYTGIIGDPDKTIEKAIRKTWASVWNFAAFEERDYFKIDHKTVAMAVLVHRSFPAEAANGVVITKNMYNPYNPAITINVQVGDISVVKPTENHLPDQIICYTFSEADGVIEYVNHSNVPGMEGQTVMTDEEIKTLKDYCMAIHYHYCRLNAECKPMDIEFKVDLVDGQRKIYIKQARPY